MIKFIFLTIFILFISPIISGEITGEITSQNIEIGIYVSTPIPILNIISPINGTYLKKELTINYTLINSDMIIYNIDNILNKTANIGEKINFTEGNHTVYFYAINQYNTTTTKIEIIINTTKFQIYYDDYKQGLSTNFYNYPYEKFSNMENIILENPEYGKILFLENINLTQDSTPTNNELDLDNNTEISYNKIYLNKNILPNFNKKAKIWIYNLNFKNPEILKNNQICPEEICKLIEYSNGILIFEVNEMDNFTIKEATTETISRGSGGGSNTKNEIKETKNKFTLIEKQLILKSNPGNILEKEIEIINNEEYPIEIEFNQKGLENILFMNKTKITLKAKESKIINLEFLIKNSIKPNSYLGELTLISGYTVEEIWIVLEIEDENILFDAKIELIDKNNKKYPGEKLLIITKLYNLGETRKIDTNLEYTIKNKDGKIIYQTTSTIAVETHLDSIEEIKLPNNILPGEYLITLKVEYENKFAIATTTFEVSPKYFQYINYYILIIIFIIIIISILIIKEKKRNHSKRKKSKSRGK
jgi:hypothetical protein